VKDNGRRHHTNGDNESGSLGLLGMKERAALLGGEILLNADRKVETLVTVRIAQTGAIAQGRNYMDSRADCR